MSDADEQTKQGIREHLANKRIIEEAAGSIMAPGDDFEDRIAEQSELARLASVCIHDTMQAATEKYAVREWMGITPHEHLAHAADHANNAMYDLDGMDIAIEHAEHLVVRATMSLANLKAKKSHAVLGSPVSQH